MSRALWHWQILFSAFHHAAVEICVHMLTTSIHTDAVHMHTDAPAGPMCICMACMAMHVAVSRNMHKSHASQPLPVQCSS